MPRFPRRTSDDLRRSKPRNWATVASNMSPKYWVAPRAPLNVASLNSTICRTILPRDVSGGRGPVGKKDRGRLASRAEFEKRCSTRGPRATPTTKPSSSPTSLQRSSRKSWTIWELPCVTIPFASGWKTENLRLRKIRKDLAGGSHPDRNAQFERIATVDRRIQRSGQPVFFRGHQGQGTFGTALPCWPSSLQSTVPSIRSRLSQLG